MSAVSGFTSLSRTRENTGYIVYSVEYLEKERNTVLSRKFEFLGTRDFILRYQNSNCKEVDIRIYNPLTINIIIKHMLCVRKRNASGRLSFTHTKRVFI